MSEPVRFPELDALRGLAVLLMVIYHTAFDLRFFYGWPIDIFRGSWWLLARTSAVLFLLVAGICFALSLEHTPPEQRLRKTLRRFFLLTGAAALISFTTWLITPQDFVKFGILHLFALSTLLLPLFAPLKHWNALLGLLIILTPILINTDTLAITQTPSPLLVLIGSPPPTLSSLDYFPLIPWFGMILLGLSLGHSFYIRNPNRRTALPIFNYQFSIFNFAGRHSLATYLIHQPILLVILTLTFGNPTFT